MAGRKAPDTTPTVKRSTAIAMTVGGLVFGLYLGWNLSLILSKDTAAPQQPVQQQPAPQAQGSSDTLREILAHEQEVAADPTNAAAWLHLANLYFDSDQPEKAIGAYGKYLAMEPGNADAWTDMGVMYRRAGKPQKAVDSFDRAIQANPEHETARFNKGVVQMHDLGDTPGAIATWEELVALHPHAKAPNGQSVDELVQQIKNQAGIQ